MKEKAIHNENAIAKENTNSIEKTTDCKKDMKSRIIKSSSQEKLKEPKISFALPVSKSSLIESDIFACIDTPVHTLPVDCLISIFEYCEGFENYCTLLGVCRRWRSIAAQPFLVST